MSSAEVAAIQVFDGTFELMRLDAPFLSGMHPDRISALDRAQLESAMAYLLPDVPVEDGVKRVLGGAVIVGLDDWLSAKRSVLPGGNVRAVFKCSFVWVGLPLLGSILATQRLG
jgi:hypothetical protein